MKTLAKLYRGQYRAIEDALETWKCDPDEAASVHDLEEIIRACILLDTATAKLVCAIWDAGYSRRIKDVQAVGHYLVSLLEAGVVTWEMISELAEGCIAAGQAVEGGESVSAALAGARALFDDFTRRWPFFKKEDMERGAKEIATGNFVTGEELLRELQSDPGWMG